MRLEHDAKRDTFTVWLDEPARSRTGLVWVDLLPGVRAKIDEGPPPPAGMTVVDPDRFAEASLEIFAIEIGDISSRAARGNVAQVANAASELLRVTAAIGAALDAHGPYAPALASEVAEAIRPADPETQGPLRLAE